MLTASLLLFYRAGVGASGPKSTLFYAEVTDSMKVGEGGGCQAEGELIEIANIPISEGKAFMYDESIQKPGTVLFAFLWFYENKCPAEEKSI